MVRFDFRDRPLERFWLLLQRPHPEVCITHPGGDDDLIVYTDVASLVDIQHGRLELTDAIAQEAFRHLAVAVSQVLAANMFAGPMRAAT